MITFLFLLVLSTIVILSIRFLNNNRKRKYPELSDKENEEAVSGISKYILWFWLIGSLAGIIFINNFYQTAEELKIQANNLKEEKIRLQIAEQNRKSIEAKKNRPVSEKLTELYSDMHKNKDTDVTTEMWFNSFAALHDEAIKSNLKDRFLKTKDSLDRRISIDQSKRESADRKKFEKDFENNLLDNGLNMKVSVSGKENRNIKITYILFNDVWRRKFETEGYLQQLNDRGFKKITLSDGYDYNIYFTFDK